MRIKICKSQIFSLTLYLLELVRPHVSLGTMYEYQRSHKYILISKEKLRPYHGLYPYHTVYPETAPAWWPTSKYVLNAVLY